MKTNYELRNKILTAGFYLLVLAGYSQSNLRTQKISFEKDTLLLDTLSIIPGTVLLKDSSGRTMDSSEYEIDFANALLILFPTVKGKGEISYRVFPYSFPKTFQHKDIGKIQSNQIGQNYVYTPVKSGHADFFKTEGLTKSGSIARGISFGNNQDVVVNSNLNLQLAGKLSDQVDVLLAATDQNIPIQPEGNTQQLQEFDKVFIQVGIKDLPAKGKTTVTAGDFQIEKPKGYFMHFNKKLQGLGFVTVMNLKRNPDFMDVKQTGMRFPSLKINGSAAVSKGRFARNISLETSNGNTFNGQKQEKNQGPYKLRGAENEPFIIVLAGTEKIFLDGELLERGQENDYVLDYNTAEVTFTPKNLITKDKRIVAEFQYSDKNYSRSLVHTGTEYESKKISAYLNLYSEQDNKNKPLQQDLDDNQKLLLASIGDSVQNAVWSSADSVPFSTSEILYEKKDTAIFAYFYPGIFVYSTDSAKAHYRLSWSFVGTSKGNYQLKQSAANGKVYEWVRPDTVTGQPKGSYEPVILLATPRQKQMLTAGMTIELSKHSRVSFEGAASNNNVNTFSGIDRANDDGFGGKFLFENNIPLHSLSAEGGMKDVWKLLTNLNYEYLQKDFAAIERFRSVEFERDWNRGNSLQTTDQHLIGGKIGIAKKQNIILYNYKSFLEGSFYEGIRHGTNINLEGKGFLFTIDGSYLDSKSLLNRTNFLRHRASFSKEFNIQNLPILQTGSKFKIGIKEQFEENFIRDLILDTLLPGSARFYEREPFAELTDSSSNKYFISYRQRMDYGRSLMKGAELHRATFAENYGGGIEFFSNPNSQFRFTGSYRKLEIADSTVTSQKPENTVIGRAEYNFILLKGFFSSGTFYEVGSGLELKKEFIFLEVAPGQGTHIWTDYNGNGIKELNEFEISPFPYEANYIKVWVPTNDYISVFANQFSEVFSVKPAAKWSSKKGLKKFVSRFHNQTVFRTDRKTTNTDLAVAYNPFLSDVQDNALLTLNSSLRNTLFFNQTAPVFGMDYTWQSVQNKSLLVNDTSFRINTFREIRARWNASRQWTFQGSYKDGIKQNDSRFFASRNFRIIYFEAEPKVSFQPNVSFRISSSWKYSEKKNTIVISPNPQAKTVLQNFGAEIRYNALHKGSLNIAGNYILIAYNETENTPLAFEMLEGLKTGENYTWNITYSHTLANNIQLNLSYEGRRSPGIKIIHTGNAQVRAFF